MIYRPIGPLLVCAFCAAGAALAPAIAAPQDQPPPASASAQASAAEANKLHFTGEATRGQPFTKDVGHNMFFRLTPATSEEGGGWVIEMLPPYEPGPGDPIEFSAIATPPYHSYNDRYIAAAFGYSVKEALQSPLRKFNFVLSVDDEHRADEVVNAALYPSTIGESERARVAAESAALMLGVGRLRLLKSKVVSGKDASPDVISWIRFEVDLDFAAGLTLQEVLAPHPPAPKH